MSYIRLIVVLTLAGFAMSVCSCSSGDAHEEWPRELPGEEEGEEWEDPDNTETEVLRGEVVEYGNGVRRHSSYFDGDEQKASDVAVTGRSRYGLIIKYYPNGRIRSVGAMMNDNRIGLWLEFDDTGGVLSENMYLDGRIVERGEVIEDE